MGLPDLYPYQKEACVSLWEVARRARERKTAGGAGERCLCVQPTGAGKTVEILAFARATTLRWSWRALVIEPTKGLVKQTKKRADNFIPEIKSGMIVEGKCEMAGVDVVISTAASLHKKRLARIDPAAFDLIMIDEAHHGSADSLITSARALLLPVESVELDGQESVVSEWHRWQFQANS